VAYLGLLLFIGNIDVTYLGILLLSTGVTLFCLMFQYLISKEWLDLFLRFCVSSFLIVCSLCMILY